MRISSDARSNRNTVPARSDMIDVFGVDDTGQLVFWKLREGWILVQMIREDSVVQRTSTNRILYRRTNFAYLLRIAR